MFFGNLNGFLLKYNHSTLGISKVAYFELQT